MSDIIDRANARAEALLGYALTRQRQRSATPPRESRCACSACGAAIPPERQRAVPGVYLCVQCQQERERRSRAYAV